MHEAVGHCPLNARHRSSWSSDNRGAQKESTLTTRLLSRSASNGAGSPQRTSAEYDTRTTRSLPSSRLRWQSAQLLGRLPRQRSRLRRVSPASAPSGRQGRARGCRDGQRRLRPLESGQSQAPGDACFETGRTSNRLWSSRPGCRARPYAPGNVPSRSPISGLAQPSTRLASCLSPALLTSNP